MNKLSRFRAVFALLAGALVLAGVAGGVASSSAQTGTRRAAPASPSGEIVTHQLERTTAQWTADQMRTARPMPLLAARAADDSAAPAPQSHGGGFTYPTPFDRYAVYPDRAVLPYRMAGKLFFRQNGTAFVCSGVSIGGAGVFTAGHCVSDGNQTWSTNVVFVPQRHNGVNPHGTFQCTDLTTATEWHVNGNLRRDLGSADGCVRPRDGKRLNQVVGKMGIAVNLASDDEHYNSLGYPAAPPFAGERMIACQSSFGHLDTLGIGGTGPLPFAIGCDMTGGSSGGPWVININGAGGATRNLLNGLNSYKYVVPAQPLEMYSPYFDDLALAVYNNSAD